MRSVILAFTLVILSACGGGGDAGNVEREKTAFVSVVCACGGPGGFDGDTYVGGDLGVGWGGYEGGSFDPYPSVEVPMPGMIERTTIPDIAPSTVFMVFPFGDSLIFHDNATNEYVGTVWYSENRVLDTITFTAYFPDTGYLHANVTSDMMAHFSMPDGSILDVNLAPLLARWADQPVIVDVPVPPVGSDRVCLGLLCGTRITPVTPSTPETPRTKRIPSRPTGRMAE